jgi:hypothetical protein
MSFPPPLLRFVEDELERAVLLIEQVEQAMMDRAQANPASERSARDRQLDHETLRALAQYRPVVTRRFAQALREQADAEIARAAEAPVAESRGAAGKLKLSLLDEDEVAADVELSRAIDSINSVAEYELRELRAFTSALAGDESVSRETNPLNAQAYARALWAAAEALPLSRAHQVAFMRLAGMPLAQCVRMASAAACTRLEDQGVEPSVYRTIVRAGRSQVLRPGERDEPEVHADLHELRDSMPVPLDPLASQHPPLDEALLHADELLRMVPDDAGPRTRLQALHAQHPALLGSADSRVDQQLIELLSRLFDAILSDPGLPLPMQVLLSRLHASALRVALREPDTLDNLSHPMWLFMDRLVFQAETHGAALGGMLRQAQSLIEHITRESVQDAALFHWGLERMLAQERHRFGQRLQGAAAQIEMLSRFATAEPAAAGPRPGLDIGSMDTVPADLLNTGPAGLEAAQQWAREVSAGQWLQVFLQGRWRTLQLLWRGPANELWLLADASDDGPTWAVRQRAIERLHGERLLNPLAPRSLVQQAADTVLRGIANPGDGH